MEDLTFCFYRNDITGRKFTILLADLKTSTNWLWWSNVNVLFKCSLSHRQRHSLGRYHITTNAYIGHILSHCSSQISSHQSLHVMIGGEYCWVYSSQVLLVGDAHWTKDGWMWYWIVCMDNVYVSARCYCVQRITIWSYVNHQRFGWKRRHRDMHGVPYGIDRSDRQRS